MPSPDLPGYVDLTIFDRTPADLVERIRANLAATLPGFVYRAGTVEAALIESLVLLVAENGYQINRIPGAVFETLISAGFGIALDQGAPPTATVDITVADNLGYLIPAGTRFQLTLGEDVGVIFTLDLDAVIAPGATIAANVAITGTTNTDVANGTAIGTALRTIDAVPAIETVELAAAPIGGAGVESIADWFARGVSRLARLSDTLVKAAHFAAAAVELEPLVHRVVVVDQLDATVGGHVAGDDPGHVSVAVLGAGGVFLSAPVKAALEAELDDLAQADLEVHVYNPTITAVAVVSTVVRQAGFASADVQANVLAALEAYLSPDTWAWGATVYRNELISVIDQAEGVGRVVSLTTPAADVALAGTAPLADFNAGGSAITVNAP